MRAILERDYGAEAVRPIAFAARTLFGAFAALTVFVVAGAGSAATDRSADVLGREAFGILGAGTLLFLAATTPVLFVGSVLGERQQGTLDLLLASPEGPRGVAAGKFLGRLGIVLTWASAVLPPLTVAVLFGGTSWRELANLTAGLLGAALELAAAGLVVSAVARRMATAAALGYLVPALHWAPGALLSAAPAGGAAEALLRATSPMACLDLPRWDRAVAGLRGGLLEGLWSEPGFLLLGVGLAMAAVAVPFCAVALDRERPESRGGRRSAVLRPRLDGRLRAWLTRGNPVAWKESLLLNTAWSRNLYYVVAAILVGGEVAFLHGLRYGWWDAEIDLWYLAGCVTLVAALAALQGAASMVFEKSQGTFDLLRVTRLTPVQIARGKVLGTLLGTGFLLLIPLGHLAISTLAGSREVGSGVTVAGYHSPGAALVAAVITVLLCANYAIHGLTWGILARTPWIALAGAGALVALGFGGCFTLCAVPFVLTGIAMVRKQAPTDFFEVIVIPSALFASPVYVFAGVVGLIDEVSTPLGMMSLGPLGAALVYGIHRWNRLPEILEWQMERMAEGPRPGLLLPVPREEPGDAVRRIHGLPPKKSAP
jgi:ABC-type transport system involved in multi-copper enzyme maturation permease subunit